MISLPTHKTKIVCTIGPASRSAEILTEMMRKGMSIARLNFSHGTFAEHERDISEIRSVAAALRRPCPLFVDLPGPKIRVGALENESVLLKKGDTVTLTTRDIRGTNSIIPVTYRRLPESVSPGSVVYLSDGFIELSVEEVTGDDVRCVVVAGGQLLKGKGLNLPGAKMLVSSPTERDIELIEFGLNMGIDIFGISFVQSADDILRAKEFAETRGKSIYTIAKIERAEAVENIDSILGVTDALMIARGDLGVEVPIEEVPLLQKELIRKANLCCRPVITATQMLESMMDNNRPTRAEATDVANAILDGTDAVMLSEETAIGNFPVETLETMAKISRNIEAKRRNIRSASFLQNLLREELHRGNITVPDTISLNTAEASEVLAAPFILVPTSRGMTARRISRFRTESWILAFNNDQNICDFAFFSYGVYPVLKDASGDEWYGDFIEYLKDSGLVRTGERIIVTEGKYSKEAGTDSLGVITV
jgi:pyruvate kinase